MICLRFAVGDCALRGEMWLYYVRAAVMATLMSWYTQVTDLGDLGTSDQVDFGLTRPR